MADSPAEGDRAARHERRESGRAVRHLGRAGKLGRRAASFGRSLLRSSLPLSTRGRLLLLGLALEIRNQRERGNLTRFPTRLAQGPRSDLTLRLDGAAVTIDAKTWVTDFSAFSYVFVEQVHGRFFGDGVVIDLGGNRGYFGSYALLNGAAAVYSFEPNSSNYASLQWCKATFGSAGHRWRSDRCAVADRDGEVDLHLSGNSWHHSIFEPASERTDAIERVPLRSFSSILDVVRSAHPTAEIAVEMTVEGAERDVILGTSVDQWRHVSALMFATDYPPEDVSRLVNHLGQAGLERASVTDPGMARPVDHPWVLVTRS